MNFSCFHQHAAKSVEHTLTGHGLDPIFVRANEDIWGFIHRHAVYMQVGPTA